MTDCERAARAAWRRPWKFETVGEWRDGFEAGFEAGQKWRAENVLPLKEGEAPPVVRIGGEPVPGYDSEGTY